MKMTLIGLLNVKVAIAPHVNEKIPFKTSYKLYKLIEAIEKEEEFYRKKCTELYNQYAERNDNGELRVVNGVPQMTEDKKQFFDKALAELNAVEVEKPDITFGVEEFEPLSLSIMEVSVLNKFIN